MSNNNCLDISLVPKDWSIIPCGVFFKEKSIKNTEGEMNLSVYRDYGVIPKDSRDDNHNRVSEDTSNYKLVEPGDFVINKMKGWSGSLGVSDYRGIVSPSYTVLEPVKEIHNKYFHYLLRSETYRQIYESLSYGVRIGQWELHYHDFKQIPSLYPPIEEQKLISRYLDKKTSRIDSWINKIERKIELLKEQRTALINHYVTKGMNPNVEMKDSGIEWIGEIPKHWECKKLKHISIVKRGSSPRPIDDPRYFDENGYYSWVRIADVSASGKYLEKTAEKLSTLGSLLSTKMCTGDIFLSIAGTVGKPIITNINCCIHDGFVWFENLKINTDFLYYCFLSGACFQGLGKMGTQLNLNTDTVGDVSIPYPSLEEQNLIANYLDKKTSRIDSLITKLSLQTDLLKEYRQALISSAVTGKIRITKDML